jgi:periplasmic copper chaperone A
VTKHPRPAGMIHRGTIRAGYIGALFSGLALLVSAAALAQTPRPDADTDLPGQRNAGADISVTAPSFQLVPGHSDLADGYFTIENRSSQTHLLTGITAPACQQIIARHTDQEPTEKTSALFTHLALPKHTAMVFSVGGYHFVCLGLKSGILPGGSVPVTFVFLGGSSRTLQFPVEQAARQE